jgi:hypothetical protein
LTDTPTITTLRQQIRDQITQAAKTEPHTSTTLNDENIGTLVQQLLEASVSASAQQKQSSTGTSTISGTASSTTSSSPTTVHFDPTTVAGMWRVIHAPHIARLSRFLMLQFDPIEYHLSNDLQLSSCVKYHFHPFAASGWLCTSGYYTTTTTTTTSNSVRIVWEKVWWNSNEINKHQSSRSSNSERQLQEQDQPTPPEEGNFPNLIQRLGILGFIEPLSYFPILYVDEQLAIFQFFGFTITAMKQVVPEVGTNVVSNVFVSRRQH